LRKDSSKAREELEEVIRRLERELEEIAKFLSQVPKISEGLEELMLSFRKARELRPKEIVWGDIIAGGIFAGSIVNLLRDTTELISRTYWSGFMLTIVVDTLLVLSTGLALYWRFKRR